MSEATPPIPDPQDGAAIDAAVLFVDLTSSSEFASVLDVREYAAYVDSFVELCEQQCAFFFDMFLCSKYERGKDYDFHVVGDELVVFLHTGNSSNDVYQLIALTIALKCGWLGVPLNARRVERGVAATELAAGINFGRIWSRRRAGALARTGFAINMAKRTETVSREGKRFRVYVTDAAFKQLNRRLRNLVFSERLMMPLKGVVVPVAVYELAESFIDPSRRLGPEYRDSFAGVARQAIQANSFDLWIHSCLQISEEKRLGNVSDEMLLLCHYILNLDPTNAVALYLSAQGFCERGNTETARLVLEDLVRYWPRLGDGWLEYGRLLKSQSEIAPARRAILQARLHGVAEEEEPLPG